MQQSKHKNATKLMAAIRNHILASVSSAADVRHPTTDKLTDQTAVAFPDNEVSS